MIEVAYLHEFSTMNGGERSFLNLLSNLDRERFTPVVLAPGDGGLADEVQKRGVEFLDYRIRQNGRRRDFDEVAAEVAAVLQDRTTTIVHGNSLSVGEYCGLIADSITGRSVVSVSHVRDIQKLKRSRVDRLNRNDAIIPVSHATKDHLVSQGVSASRLHVIWNGINQDFGADHPPPSGLWAGDDGHAPLVACIGQICLRKAQNLCLEAMVPVLRSRPHVHFVVVGERFSQKEESVQFERALEDGAAQAGVSDQVHLLGYRNDVPALMRRIHVLAHAAHQEPLGRVLIEAHSAGVPVVCTDVGGSREIVEDRVTGFVVPPEDARQLGDHVATLLDDSTMRDQMGAAARARAEDRFDPTLSSRRVMDLYDALVSRPAP